MSHAFSWIRRFTTPSIFRSALPMILVFGSLGAAAELPINVQAEWRSSRFKLARVLLPEFRIALRDPIRAEARLTGVLLKLVRMDVALERDDGFVGDKVLDFVVRGAIADALRDAWPANPAERENLVRYLNALAEQAEYDGAWEIEDTVKKAIRRSNRFGYVKSALVLAGLVFYDFSLGKMGLYWVPGTHAAAWGIFATAVAMPFWGRPVPFRRKFPEAHLGAHFEDCERILVELEGNFRDVTPRSSRAAGAARLSNPPR